MCHNFMNERKPKKCVEVVEVIQQRLTVLFEIRVCKGQNYAEGLIL